MKKRILLPVLSGLVFQAQAATIYPGAILGRDLFVKGAGWLGHVGIATADIVEAAATHVIEVLNETEVIQYNPIHSFLRRSRYWGSRSGLPVSKHTVAYALQEANTQRVMKCLNYTAKPVFVLGQGYWRGPGVYKCTMAGLTRCDTFLRYIFAKVGVNISYTPPLLPTSLFRGVPIGNQDGPYAMRESGGETEGKKRRHKAKPMSLGAAAKMQTYEFVQQIEALNKTSSQYLLNLAVASTLPIEKRVLVVDKLGFLGDISIIPKLISIYHGTNPGSETSLREQLLDSMYRAYHVGNCMDSQAKSCFVAKQKLVEFYLGLLEDGPEKTEKTVDFLTFGVENLASPELLVKHHEKLHALIDDEVVNMSPGNKFLLKYNLSVSVPGAKKEYMYEILELLKAENSLDLEASFHFYFVKNMVGSQQKTYAGEVLKGIKAYLEHESYKYAEPERAMQFASNGDMFRFGSWLEATALANTKTLDEAAQYIADFLKEQGSIKRQSYFVTGLSNSEYLKKAFNEIPVLQDFKKADEGTYLVSVGYLPPEAGGLEQLRDFEARHPEG